MKYIGYVLAIVIGVAGLISGITTGAWLIVGLAVGWLIVSVWFIIRRESATVEGRDDAIFAIFEGTDIVVGLVAIAIIAASTVLTWVFYRFVLNAPV